MNLNYNQFEDGEQAEVFILLMEGYNLEYIAKKLDKDLELIKDEAQHVCTMLGTLVEKVTGNDT